MAYLVVEFETNKNCVIFHYPHLYPVGPSYKGQRPTGCVVNYFGYYISASMYEKGFRVFNNSENISKLFLTLKEAKNFIKLKINKKRTLFD